ncbi:MAG: TlpA family protein disulfide reductase [Planctomycetes bacterium]|nr:TlpA family protein disulfide reductase [Planctomycetota bacterium]
MKLSCGLGFGCLVLAAVLAALPSAGAQSAGERYNQILQETEEDYYSCAKVKDKKAREKAYIEHGQRATALWEGFLRDHGETSMAFNARLNLAQALDMAKETARARAVMEEAAAAAYTFREITQAAEITKIVCHSVKDAYDVIERAMAKVDEPEMKGSLHLELFKYLEMPKNLQADEQPAHRKKMYRELAEAIVKQYPDTSAAKEAGLILRGLDLKVGDPLLNLADFTDAAGDPIDLAAYSGKVVLLHFWTGPRNARRSLQTLVNLHGELHPKGLEVVGINCDYAEDHERNMLAMIEALGIPWRNYHDGQKLHNRIARIFHVRKYPSNIVIGRDGKIAALDVPTAQLEDKLRELVGGS